MENNEKDSTFADCVRQIQRDEAARAKEAAEIRKRLGLDLPDKLDRSKPITIARRLGLK